VNHLFSTEYIHAYRE